MGKSPRYEEEVYDEYEDEELAGCSLSGCGWGIAGMFGCITIPLVILAVVVVLGYNTISGITSSINEIFFPSEYNVTNMTIVLEQVQALSELTTTRHTYSVNITNEREDSILPGALSEDVLNMNVIAHVAAGIDLSLVTEEDIRLQNGVFTLQLPAPQIQDCIIDEQLTTVLRRSTGWLVGGSPELDIDTRRAVSRHIGYRAIDDDILEEANAQAQQVIGLFMSILPMSEDINRVDILITPPDPEAPLPEGCS